MDTSTRVGRVIGVVTLASNATGSISIPKLATETAWATLASSDSKVSPRSTLTLSNQATTSATATYNLGPAAARLIYGVY